MPLSRSATSPQTIGLLVDLTGASREVLLAVLAGRDAAIEELRGSLAEPDAWLVERDGRLMALAEQVAALQARVGRDSTNSSRPVCHER